MRCASSNSRLLPAISAGSGVRRVLRARTPPSPPMHGSRVPAGPASAPSRRAVRTVQDAPGPPPAQLSGRAHFQSLSPAAAAPPDFRQLAAQALQFALDGVQLIQDSTAVRLQLDDACLRCHSPGSHLPGRSPGLSAAISSDSLPLRAAVRIFRMSTRIPALILAAMERRLTAIARLAAARSFDVALRAVQAAGAGTEPPHFLLSRTPVSPRPVTVASTHLPLQAFQELSRHRACS